MAQPPPSRLSPRGLLTLPYRLCNPPPAVGKVRSCGLTPMLDVRLDDVLARKHLPPIGLKDFEEYLLYVEHAPENLYFILWLKDYTIRYSAWARHEKSHQTHKKEKIASKLHPTCRMFSIPPTPDPSLAMFYARAKQTFFTPNAEYELNIPSDVLAPFHCAPHTAAFQARIQMPASPWHSQSVHPDPAIFTEVAIEARNMLHESLGRFVRAAHTNVGSGRAACGIIVGFFLVLVGGVLPLVLTTGRWNVGPHGRLMRLVACPGMWLGLTILIASFQGICLMVYVFGDLRQLRKFELARPAISRPIPMHISAPVMQGPPCTSLVAGLTVPTSHPSPSEKYAGEEEGEKSLVPASPSLPTSPTSPTSRPRPPLTYARSELSEASSEGDHESTTSCESCDSRSWSSVSCNEIDVSPAFFDEVPAPEGPATASCLYRPEYRALASQPQYRSSPLASPEPAHVRSSPVARPVPLPVASPVPVQIPIPSSFGHAHMDPRGIPSRGVGISITQSVPEYGPSAGFIPHDYSSDGSASATLRSRSGTESFDFDLLPEGKKVGLTWRGEGVSGAGSLPITTTTTMTTTTNASSQPQPSPQPEQGSTPGIGPRTFLGRAQYKCAKRIHRSTDPFSASPLSTPSPTTTSFTSSFPLLVPSFTAGVPVFAAPFTQVRSDVVRRAQWEVVVRASLAAFVCTGVVVGVIVGVVP